MNSESEYQAKYAISHFGRKLRKAHGVARSVQRRCLVAWMAQIHRPQKWTWVFRVPLPDSPNRIHPRILLMAQKMGSPDGNALL